MTDSPSLMMAWPALALLLLLVGVAWLLKLLRQSGWQGVGSATQATRLVSVLNLGPQQKVVTVEVGQGEHRRWLVLGVTAHSINRLDTLEGAALPAIAPTAAVPSHFAARLAQHLKAPHDR